MEIFTQSAKGTQRFGQKFGSSLKGGEVIALVGDLGSGKTTFVQGLSRGFGVTERIISPTFILMRQYSGSRGIILYHIDLYRLETGLEQEVENLGLEDLLGKKENIVVIEWADKIREMLAENTIWVSFEQKGDKERRITINC